MTWFGDLMRILVGIAVGFVAATVTVMVASIAGLSEPAASGALHIAVWVGVAWLIARSGNRNRPSESFTASASDVESDDAPSEGSSSASDHQTSLPSTIDLDQEEHPRDVDRQTEDDAFSLRWWGTRRERFTYCAAH